MLSQIREAIDQLPQLRVHPDQWARCAYQEKIDATYGPQDAHEQARFRVLIALQYGYTDDDEALVEYLFDQELMARKSDGFQGIGEPLELASYLLSRWKRPANLWRFAAAKVANFDTYCGYDSTYLVSAGLEPTFAELASSDHELKESVQSLLFDEQQNCLVTAEELNEWEARMLQEFPRDPQQEPLMTWIERALYLGLHEEGQVLLDQYEATDPDATLSELCYLRDQLGDTDGAITLRTKMLNQETSQAKQVILASRLAELLVKADRYEEAWQLITRFEDALRRSDQWQNIGLGRSYVEYAFQVAKSASPETAQRAFAWACTHEQMLTNKTLLILTLATEAARALGDTERTVYDQAAADAEQARIDAML